MLKTYVLLVLTAFCIVTRAEQGGGNGGLQAGLYMMNFVNGQQVSLEDTNNYVNNLLMNYGNGSWIPSASVYWQDTNVNADFYAYAPFKEDVTDARAMVHCVATDQTSEEAFHRSDLLWGAALGQSPLDGKFSLMLTHQLSLLTVVVTAGTGFSEGELTTENVAITIGGSKTLGIIDLQNGTVSATGEVADVKCYNNGDLSYRAVLLPQQIPFADFIQVEWNGNRYTIQQSFKLEAKKQYRLTIKLNKSQEGLDVGIDGWDDDGEDLGGTAEGRALLMTARCDVEVTDSTSSDWDGSQSGDLDPNHPAVTITAKSYTREYGNVNPVFEYMTTGATLVGSPEITCEAIATSPVGSYDIVVKKGSVKNYNVSYVAGMLTITKAPLTITAMSYTITQGDALPTFEAEYSGFKNDETADILTKRPTLTTSVTSSSEPGTFDIIASGAEAQNYEISYVKGTLTINPGVYKLTYTVDGEVYKTYDIEYGATITPEAEPTKEGYTFSGWSTIPETMPAHDVTISGTFIINKYKLTYVVDGEVYKTYDIEYGASITPEAEPTKEGYTFSGWSTIPTTMPAYDVTITGSFTKGAYKLTYMLDGVVYKTISYDYGDAITPEPAPTKEGYTFSGWSEIPETMPAHDVTVTGTFSINKYKLTYTVDGEVYKTYEMEYGATITPEAEPAKEGYTFSGWSTIPATMPAYDVTITGTFKVNKYKVNYFVDNNPYYTDMVEYGAIITPPNVPEREGYDFAWVYIPDTMPAYDISIYGQYTIKTGIEEIMSNANGDVMIFTIDGKRVDNLKKGMNIIRMKDGTTRKVVVK